MSEALPVPKVLRSEQNIQLSYETPHRIHDIALYPFCSPNGSSITIYGHENGIRIIWRGGRPFRPQSIPEEKSKTNGANTDNIMVIDSDDEPTGSHAPMPSFEDKPVFGNVNGEIDPSMPYPRTLQYLDLNFGAAALHIAIPPISPISVDVSAGLSPAILNDQLVIVVACSDQKLRLITRPLSPPSPQSKTRQDIRSTITASYAGHGKWGETVLDLMASILPVDSLSITFTKVKRSTVADGDDALRRARSTSTSRLQWHILVASCSQEGPGLLLIHRIPIISTQKEDKNSFSLSSNCSAPFQRIPLSSPAISVAFNPNISSLTQSTHLLVADKTGACRILDCEPSHALASMASDNLSSAPLLSQRGSWLLTMYSGFPSLKSDAQNTLPSTSLGTLGRKVIVDAKWAMGGKAIIALLADGEWGLWDLDGEGSVGGGKGILSQQSIRGGAMTAFSVSGWVDSAPIKSSSTKAAMTRTSSSKFAPMTPSTRKTAEPVLFSGKSSHGFVRGKISIVRLPATSTISLVEESVAFWLEDSYCVVPNLRAYWDVQRRRSGGAPGNLLGSGGPMSRGIRLEGVNLRGDRCCGIDQRPREFTSKSFLSTDILILGEHRYIVVLDNTHQPRGPKWRTVSHDEYQTTASRDLDVTEIDQVLSQMENDGPSKPMRKAVGSFD